MNVLALLRKMRSTGVAAASTRRLAEESSSFSVACESWVRLFLGKGSDLIQRPVVRGVVAAGIVAAGISSAAPPAQALVWRPGIGIRPSLKWVVQCGTSGSLFTPCFPKRGKTVYIVFDPPAAGLTEFTTTFNYDRTFLSFNPAASSLLCSLRSASATPFCPTTPAGVGTQPIGTIDEFEIDQTGLSIKENSTGSVTVNYTTSQPIADAGEINFLALAFDALVPLDGANVTYSPSVIPNATFSISDFSCNINCGSANPSSSLKLNPVPGPLGLGGLPVLYHATRRIRRRNRLGAPTPR